MSNQKKVKINKLPYNLEILQSEAIINTKIFPNKIKKIKLCLPKKNIKTKFPINIDKIIVTVIYPTSNCLYFDDILKSNVNLLVIDDKINLDNVSTLITNPVTILISEEDKKKFNNMCKILTMT